MVVQNNQPRSLGLNRLFFFFKQKHMLIDDTFFFCRFMSILMNCLCKNKSFIPFWILIRWLQGKSHYFISNDLSFQIVAAYNWELKTVKSKQDGLIFSNRILWLKVNLFSKVLTINFKFSVGCTLHALLLKTSTICQFSATSFAQTKKTWAIQVQIQTSDSTSDSLL